MPAMIPVWYHSLECGGTTLWPNGGRTRFSDPRYYSQPARGGYYPSLKQPQAFVTEVRT